MHAVITGVGHYFPDRKLTNQELEKMVDTNDEWITTRTGIKERRILDNGRGTSYMATKAARMVLEQTGTQAEEIDLIILATVTPDMPVPAAAPIVQEALNAKNAWAFDLNGGCTGFIYALATGSQFIETGKYRKVLIIGADKMSSIIDYQERNTCVLFGDAAGAVLLEATENKHGIRDFILHSDGVGAKFLYMTAGGSVNPATLETVEKRKHYVYQDGKAVFKRAVTDMANVSAEIMKKNGLTGGDIKFLVPHQANLRIIDAVARKMELDPHQVVINIQKYGNTTAATIPLAMSETYQANKLKKDDWIIVSAFGAGFTWGSLLLKWALD